MTCSRKSRPVAELESTLNRGDSTLQRKNWTQEQIIGLLRQAEPGDSTIAELCRVRGVSENTFYKLQVAPEVWQYGSMPVNEAKRLD